MSTRPRPLSSALVALVALRSVAMADPVAAPLSLDEVAYTRSVIAERAEHDRHVRIVAGVAAVSIGVGAGVLGFALTRVDDTGGFVDFSPIARVTGWIYLVGGGLDVIAGSIALASRRRSEDIHDDLEAAIARGDGSAVRIARMRIATQATRDRERRKGLRRGGIVFLAGGAAAIAVGGLGGRSFSSETAGLVIGSGSIAFVGGGVMAILGAKPSAIEDLDAELRSPPPTTAMLVPVPVEGGALVTAAGSF